MARSPNRRPYKQVPKGRIPLRALLWLFALSMCLAGVGVLAANAMSRATLTSSKTFLGKMTSQTQPVRVALPAGVVVEDVLVSNGDTVRRGQTLLSFDQQAMEAALTELHDLNFKDQAKLRCLFSENDDEAILGSLGPSSEPMDACQKILTEQKRLTQVFDAQSAKSEQEISLIDRYLDDATSLHRRQKDAPNAQVLLDRILALSLTKANMENALNLTMIEHQDAIHELSLKRSELILSTQNAMRDRQQRVSELSALLETPRLQAPMSGKIIRLRRPPLGSFVQKGTEVLSLLPQREIGYSVQFSLANGDAGLFKVGDIVALETIGLPALVDGLDATISAVSRSEPGALFARADLSLAATQTMAESPYSRQILANSSAVTVRIHKIPVAATDLISNTLAGAIVLENAPALSALIDRVAALQDWRPQRSLFGKYAQTNAGKP